MGNAYKNTFKVASALLSFARAYVFPPVVVYFVAGRETMFFAIVLFCFTVFVDLETMLIEAGEEQERIQEGRKRLLALIEEKK